MSQPDEDDKPTVVLDLHALKKQKLLDEDKLAHIEEEIEFDVLSQESPEEIMANVAVLSQKEEIKIVLFDFQSNFFQKTFGNFPKGYVYIVATTLDELNKCLRSKDFQIIVMNYDVNAKAINTLSAQIKNKFPGSKVLIMAKAISPEKAKIHAQTAAGASGYYQLPLKAEKIAEEFKRIYQSVKKAG